MTVTTYDRIDNDAQTSSGTLRRIFDSMTAAREQQMRHRVDATLNSLDADNLAAYGYDRRARRSSNRA